MEFSFASDGVNNPYFDRIAHVGAETSVTEVQTCLEFCNIAKGSVFKPGLTFIERNCLSKCGVR